MSLYIPFLLQPLHVIRLWLPYVLIMSILEMSLLHFTRENECSLCVMNIKRVLSFSGFQGPCATIPFPFSSG